MKRTLLAIGVAVLTFASCCQAADLIEEDGAPVPPPGPVATGELGIWGAIAFSSGDKAHGMFWGAGTRQEAEGNARNYCEHALGANCNIVQVFRNHRHWDDDDHSGFPYNYCAALAIDMNGSRSGVASAMSKAEAARGAVSQCGADSCRVVENGCT